MKDQAKTGPSYGFKRKISPYLFVSPFFILFLIFGAFPILYALYLSFHSWNGISGSAMKFIGFENYTYTVTDPLFWQALKNTIILAVESSLPQHIIALFFAFILNIGVIKLKNFFKASLFLPYITSTVAVAMIFVILYGYPNGFLNYILISVNKLFGDALMHPPFKWLGTATLMIPSIAFMIIWRWTGWNTILYLAGLQAIPNELYEAARVDGAKWHQVFFKITLPSLKPMLQFAITMSIIGSMQIFNEPLILVNKDGGNGRAAYTLAMYLYQTGFEWNFFGGAAAISYVIFAMILILTFIFQKLLRFEEGQV